MSDGTHELPVLIGPGDGEQETLMLISAPDAHGTVLIRRWSASDWSAAPSSTEMNAQKLFEWLEHALRARRTMNQSLTQLRLWLRQ
jgi:hypothetical protein